MRRIIWFALHWAPPVRLCKFPFTFKACDFQFIFLFGRFRATPAATDYRRYLSHWDTFYIGPNTFKITGRVSLPPYWLIELDIGIKRLMKTYSAEVLPFTRLLFCHKALNNDTRIDFRHLLIHFIIYHTVIYSQPPINIAFHGIRYKYCNTIMPGCCWRFMPMLL